MTRRALIQIRNDADAALRESVALAKSAMRDGKASDPLATFTFSSAAQLFSVITPKRWELIEHLQRIGPSTIRGLARSLEREYRRVHDDVTALVELGLVEKTEDRTICVPFDLIHAGFDLRAAA